MRWNLQIKPKGLLLSRYLKNIILLNPDNVNNVEKNPLLNDVYQTYNQSTNTANLIFKLSLYSDDPTNTLDEPAIVAVPVISISNDENFSEVYTLAPENFSSNYNNDTDYVIDLSSYNPQSVTLPASQSVAFTETSGEGNIIIKNWPLSGSSGKKKVYVNLSATLSDGTSAQYPNSLSTYDEIIVCDANVSAPGIPEALNKSHRNFASTPLYFESNVASNYGVVDTNDHGIAAYLWDSLVLTNSNNITRNNRSQSNIQLFDTVSVSAGKLNQETLPIVYTNTSTGTWSVAAYESNIVDDVYSLSSSNNVYFYEAFVSSNIEEKQYVSGKSVYYELNIGSVNGATKFLRNQIVLDQKFDTITVVTSVDDTTWSTDTSYIPAATYQETIISNPDLASKITQSGSFTLLVEQLDATNKVFQAKVLFKGANQENNFVLCDFIFSSQLLTSGVDIYAEFKSLILGADSTVIIESNQYGVCSGIISASSTPTDKIKSNEFNAIENTTSGFSNSEELNTWFILTNSPRSGVIGDSTEDLTFYNQSSGDALENLSTVEVQANIPTFSETSFLQSTFRISNTFNAIKTGYSFDSNLNYEDFVFTNLLQKPVGVSLPQQTAAYDFMSSISWSGNDQFDINVFDVGLAQTCSLSTTVTDSLFFYSKENNQGTLTPPTVIKSLSPLSTSKTFNTWVNPNGFLTSAIEYSAAIVKNEGNEPIYVNAGSGINTIVPGQPFVVSPISVSSSSPTSFQIDVDNATVSNSINFLYDFGDDGVINNISADIKIVEPPECPFNLPSFKYSVEVSKNFYNWTAVTTLTADTDFDPSTGKVTLTFSGINSADVRYARLRLYYDPSVTFDPREVYNYSNLDGSHTSATVALNNGKFILGFTDTSAKNVSLGSLYNQPTYTRRFISNNSFVSGVVFDLTDYNNATSGPVYISLLSGDEEEKVYTINSGFNINTDYTVLFSVFDSGENDSFALKTSISIFGGSLDITINPDKYYNRPELTSDIVYGFYPFASLTGNGNISLRAASFKGLPNVNFEYDNSRAYFSVLASENADYTSTFGKNLLAFNSYDITASTAPVFGTYFAYNIIKEYNYDNVTFSVKAVTTAPVPLYGYTDFDGIYVDSCDYVLVVGQADKAANGVYQVQKKQWVKQNPIPVSSNLTEPTILVEQGNIFKNTLWMQDVVTQEWIPNVIGCRFVLPENNLLFTAASDQYKYPQYARIGMYALGTDAQNTLNQVQLKFVNTPNGFVEETSPTTQWLSTLQNNKLYDLNEKAQSNNTIFMNFSISSSQIQGIATNGFPSVYSLLVSYSGRVSPAITRNSDFVLPQYGSDYRFFINDNLIYQLYSLDENYNIGSVSTSVVNSSLYGVSVSGARTVQSGFSSDIYVDNAAPTTGVLSVSQDNVKNLVLGLSTVFDSGAGLSIARFVQNTPANETVYSSWFGFNNSSYADISSFTVYPSFVPNAIGVTTGEPLSGIYKYKLQVADAVGNISETNSVESLYYESAIVDTKGPNASVKFVDPAAFNPISVSSSTIVTAEMLAVDTLSQVKAFRYRILPQGDFGPWLDYNPYSDIFLPESVSDGILSIQFQFKDYGNNVLYYDATVAQDKLYVYTWNIVSKLITNTLFTVTESTIYNNVPALLIGASKQNNATLFIWSDSKLIELQYSGFTGDTAVTSLLKVGSSVVIGTNTGKIYVYRNGVISGPFAQLKWGDEELAISKFELHQYNEDTQPYVYATTLKIPRIFRTPQNNLRNLEWEVVQTNPVYMEQINVINTGLFSGNSVNYSLTLPYQQATLDPVISYGISSVIVNNGGSGLAVAPTLTVTGVNGASLQPVMQGSISQLVIISNGVGYTSGATVSIAPPAAGVGTVQATGIAVTNALGQIVSLVLTNPGYGYTNRNPQVTIVGNSGFGSRATASAVTQYDSIYSVNVVASGIATTSDITISAPNGAILTPSVLYRFDSLSITNTGFGYTSDPIVSLNGITTLATASVKYGSVQSVTLNDNSFTFPLATVPSASIIGGVATNYVISLTTSAVSFSTGSGPSLAGTIVDSITISGNGLGFGTLPLVVFDDTNMIFEPQLEYVTSDDLITYLPSGSIYDIKSYNNNIFITNSLNGIVEIKSSDNQFTADNESIKASDQRLDALMPLNLSVKDSNLYFTVKESPFVGVLKQETQDYVFSRYNNNVLQFKPNNFDIISNWQLKKIINSGGSADVQRSSAFGNSVVISSANAQVFYESTKENTWFNRCSQYNDYLVTLELSPSFGTQSFEISTFNSTLRVAFVRTSESLKVYYGYESYEVIDFDLESNYVFNFVKNGADLYIYNANSLKEFAQNFFNTIQANPVIRFGYIFEPQELTANGQTIKVFGYPNTPTNSNFTWSGIKISFDNSTSGLPFNYYNTSLPYVLPNSENVRAIKTLNGYLYAATKSITDTRTTTNLSDVGSKVYRLNGEIWEDVTGNFETYTAGVSTSYVITSPNDINALGDSYFVTGLIKTDRNRQPQASIILGISTNIVFEEQNNAILSVIYPYNNNPSGVFINLTANNNLVTLPSSVYFTSGTLIQTVSVGIGSTDTVTSVTINATDGVLSENVALIVQPIGLSTFGLSTNLFTGYSQDSVIASITLNSTPQTNRTINLTSNNSSVLNVPAGGLATVLSGNKTVFVPLSVGTAVTANTPVTLTASYRGVTGLATATAQPFVFSFGLSTNTFISNDAVMSISATASINKSPVGVLTVPITSNNTSLLSVSGNGLIRPSTFSTSVALVTGVATVFNTNINVTGAITGSIQTSTITARPILITSAVSNLNNPVLGLQTANITFSISTSTKNNVTITNVVSSPTLTGLVFPTLSTVQAGSLTTTFGISTTLTTAAGIAITVQGRPFGFNTSPTPGLTLVTNNWRITGLQVSPTSIVGGGANANGIAQSFAIGVTLNVGFATTVSLTANVGANVLHLRNISFSTTGTGSATSIGYATAFSTSIITNVTITATGPSGVSTSVSGLSVNPFLISSFSTGYIWDGTTFGSPSYTVGGIGATVQGTLTLNAYVATGLQTINIYNNGLIFVYGQSASGNRIGLATVSAGFNTAIVNFGAVSTSHYISTSVTAQLVSYPTGLTTQVINVDKIPTWSAELYPVYGFKQSQINISLQSSLPVGVIGTFVFDSNFPIANNYNFVINASNSGVNHLYTYPTFSLDRSITANVTLLGTLQTYYTTGYAKSGSVYGMGFNYYGELSRFYPVNGPTQSSANKVFMGLSGVVKTASGYHHNIALDDKGNAYGIGYNAFGQLGYSGISTNIFRRININEYITDIQAQNNSSYLVTASGKLYGFGQNNLNSLASVAFASTSVPYLITTSVQLFSVYGDRGLYVTYGNTTGIQTVYEFGGGATGITSKPINQLTYQGVNRNISNLVIYHVSAGQNHTLASGIWNDVSLGVTSKGVFAWGSNSNFQIGTSTPVGFITTPNIIHLFTDNGFDHRDLIDDIYAESKLSGLVESFRPNNEFFVSSVVITNRGIGYTNGATVTFSAPPFTPSAITATGVAVTNNIGIVSSVLIVNEGSGYNLGAAVTFSPPPPGVGTAIATGVANVVGNKVTSITITDPGYGYLATPEVYITPIANGSGAIGVASVIYSEVTGITITNPGFGYTSAPTITITSSYGIGAAATALIDTAATPVNTIYQVGASNTSNASGFNLAQTSNITSLSLNYNELLHKFSKNSQHFVWVVQSGLVFVSGGSQGPFQLLKLYSTNYSGVNPVLYAQNVLYRQPSGVISELENAVVNNNSSKTWSSFTVGTRLFNYNLRSQAVKNIRQPNVSQTYANPVYQAVLMQDGTVAAIYVNNLFSNTEVPQFVDRLHSSASATDITVPVFGSVNQQGVYILYYNQLTGRTNVVLTDINNNFESVFNKITGSVVPVKMDATWIQNITRTGKPISPLTNNVVIGYNNGVVELYAKDTTFFLVSSWTVDGSVTALQSVNTAWDSGSGQIYLIVATQNRKIYSYRGDGGTARIFLNPGDALPLFSSVALDSVYGYVTLIESYANQTIMVATSNNYLLIMDAQTLEIYAYAVVPGAIRSMTWSANSTLTSLVGKSIIFVSTDFSSYAYELQSNANNEIGLNFYNSTGTYQLMTDNGFTTGNPITNVIHASTNDTFTVIVKED